MGRIPQQTSDSLVILPGHLRRNLETMVLLRAQPPETISVDETGPRRAAAVGAAAMPRRPEIKKRRALRHRGARPVDQVRPVPGAQISMTAGNHARRAILRRKVGKSPHHRELQFESRYLDRIGRVIAMQLLLALPRQNLDARGAADLIFGAGRQ